MKEIQLTQGKVALVDDEDYEYLNQWKWYLRKNKNVNYAARDTKRDINGKHRNIHLHRIIMNTPDGLFVDHIDHDGLNCQKSNMRNCTRSQNAQNLARPKSKTSNYFGVCWDKNRNKWMSQITIDQKHINIGRFNLEQDAAIARDIKAKEYFKDFAVLNLPDKNITIR